MILAITGVGLSAGTAAAHPDPDWWQNRSVEERQGIVNQYYGAAGQPMPYPAQATLATGALTHLRETTPEGSRGTLGTQFTKDGIAVALLPSLERWVPRLFKYGPPPVLAASVAIQIPSIGKWLYSRWLVNVSDPPSRIIVQGARYAAPGFNIYGGATARGEWLLTGMIDDTYYSHAMRWFEAPCTWSGLPAPPGARLRTHVPTTVNCRYPINHSPWYAEAPVYVDYPYLTDEDLRLDDYPDLSSDFTRPRDSVILGEPTPAPLQTEPLLEDLLERDDHTDLRRRLLVALVTERILQNNTDAVTSGDFDKQRARIIADACVAQADATPVMTSADCGRRDLPMFVAGRGDYPDATDHVKRALEHQPTWFKLRYYNRPAGESVWRSGLSETDDPTTECKGSGLQPDPTATACDEVPFLRTEEGTDKDMEGNQRPQAFVPHLKTISARDNSGSGGAYGRMVSPTTGCAMDLRRDHPLNGGGYFLVVAVPSAQVPTFHLCNGSNP